MSYFDIPTLESEEEIYVIRSLKFWDNDGIYTHTESQKVQSNIGLPRNCTEIDLPELGENETAQWNGENWVIVEDHRGTVVYNTETKEKLIWLAAGEISDGYTETALPDSFSSYYKWDSGSASWTADVGKKSDALAELVDRFNTATKALILESTVTYSNGNGSITVTCDESTQQNAALQYPLVSEKTFPYTVWDKTESLELADSNELAEFYKQIMNKPEAIRTERKAVRDTFYNMAIVEIIEQLKALNGK